MPAGSMSRRRFMSLAARCGLGLGTAGLVLDPRALERLLAAAGGGDALAGSVLDELLRTAPRARFWALAGDPGTDCLACHGESGFDPAAPYDHRDPSLVQCLLCAQRCRIPAGERGRCGVRYNHEGELRSLVYGRPVAVHVDPIEKKPFYHFLPGSRAYSLATVGCALHCKFCQNWEISQARPEDHPGRYVGPQAIADDVAARQAPIVAFTYNEPTVFCEYLIDIATAARAQGLRAVLISCGFMNEAPLAELCGCLDAIKIDLKGFSRDFYRQVCSAELDPVLRSIKQAAGCGVHLELVNLVVPTLNDAPPMLAELCRWVAAEVGPDVPVHFTRFHPDYQLQHLPPTPVASLERARETALAAGLRYPYVGNVPGHPGNHTYCPGCGEVVIRRRGFLIEENRVRAGRCDGCGTAIAGIWS